MAASRFVDYVKEVKHRCRVKPILVSHGDDITILVNSFALAGYDTEIVEVIGGPIDNFSTRWLCCLGFILDVQF